MPRRRRRGMRVEGERELTQGEQDRLFVESVPAWARLLHLVREAREEAGQRAEPKEAA